MAMGCATAQMDHEMKKGQPLSSPPTAQKMDRGGGTLDDEEDPDAWWKKPER